MPALQFSFMGAGYDGAPVFLMARPFYHNPRWQCGHPQKLRAYQPQQGLFSMVAIAGM